MAHGRQRNREPRRPVLIRARMRLGSRWDDLCILNLSSRGLMARMKSPPAPGSFVEVRRGQHVIVARVVWTDDQKFGAHTQDSLPVGNLIADEPSALAERRTHARPHPGSAKRARPRLDDRHAASRNLSRLLEYAFFMLVGISAAIGASASIQEAFASPMDAVSAALGGSAASAPAPNP